MTPFVFGSLAAEAPQVVLYGNCQILCMAPLLAAADDRYQYVCLMSYSAPHQPLRLPQPEDLRRCVLYLEQFDSKEDDLLPIRRALRALMPPSCPRLIFPSFIFRGFWPFETKDPRVTSEEGYLWGRYPYGDRLVQKMAGTGLSGGAAFKEYLHRSMVAMPDMAGKLAQEEQRILRRDQACDVAIGDYVLDVVRRRHFFWTSGHITPDGLGVLASRLYGAAQAFLGGEPRRGQGRLQAMAADLPPMGPLQVPIHPYVAEAAGLAFWHPEMRYRWYDNLWTFEEYITRYLAYDRSW